MKNLNTFALAVKIMREKQRLHPADAGKNPAEKMVDNMLLDYEKGGMFGLYLVKE